MPVSKDTAILTEAIMRDKVAYLQSLMIDTIAWVPPHPVVVAQERLEGENKDLEKENQLLLEIIEDIIKEDAIQS